MFYLRLDRTTADLRTARTRHALTDLTFRLRYRAGGDLNDEPRPSKHSMLLTNLLTTVEN